MILWGKLYNNYLSSNVASKKLLHMEGASDNNKRKRKTIPKYIHMHFLENIMACPSSLTFTNLHHDEQCVGSK